MKTKITSLILASLFGATIASQAAVITMPTGLSAGDQYRLVFVTSTTIAATSTEIATYNTFVNDLATLEGLNYIAGQTTTWTAIGSTATDNARDNTSTTGAGTGIGIYLLNDTTIATSYTDLWDGAIANLFNVDESGNSGPYANSQVWTGTNGDGSTGTDPLGTATPEFGKTNLTGSNKWINRLSGASWPNTDTYHLFAISGILTVPEPSSTALLGLGGLALMLRRKRS